MTPSWPRLPRPLLLASLAFLVLALAPAAAGAATVANTNDSGPGSLRQAIAAAAPGETIALPAGTYTLASELPIGKGLTIAGAGAATTTIRAGVPNIRLLNISGVEIPVAISGVTLRDVAFREPAGIVNGGAILNQEGHLSLNGVAITGNVVDVSGLSGGNGGIAEGVGVASMGAKARLDITASTISGNLGDVRGGAGKNGGIVEGVGVLAISGAVSIADSTIAGNRGLAGGGQGPASPLQNGGIAEGGGVLLISTTSGPMTRVTIANNLADAAGGPGANTGIAEGGGYQVSSGTGAYPLTEATITGNVVSGGIGGIVEGGGILATLSGTATMPILSSTLAGNAARDSGGNFLGTSRVSFANTIVSGGVGKSGKENCSFAEAPISLGFNLDSLDQCGFHSPGDRVSTNPQLGPLAANGGPTPTMLPAFTSPAIDQGAGFGLSADQRGVVRPIDFPSIANAPGGNGADIGAVEAQPSNAIALGKLKKNKKKGTAVLTVFLPTPNVGTISLAGKGLKPQSTTIAGTQPTLTLKVIPSGRAVKKALRKKGKRKVAINVTYQPLDNAALTQTRTTKLVKKHRKHHRAHR